MAKDARTKPPGKEKPAAGAPVRQSNLARRYVQVVKPPRKRNARLP